MSYKIVQISYFDPLDIYYAWWDRDYFFDLNTFGDE